MVEMKDVTFRYGRKQALFDGLTVDLRTDSIYGLLGRNGAGKTTLLKLICGLRFPESGTISILGHEPQLRDPSLMENLFFVPEEYSLPAITAAQFAWMYGALYPRFSHEQYEACCREFQLDTSQKLSELSYGQKKKALLAFGIAANTALLLLDEPTNGLDIPSKGQFRRLLAGAANDERVILVSTHQVRDMENLIDPIVVLEDGQIIFNQSVEEITSRLAMGVGVDDRVDAIYSERTLGGFSMVHARRDEAATRIDLELLFNAITACPAEIRAQFAREVAR